MVSEPPPELADPDVLDAAGAGADADCPIGLAAFDGEPLGDLELLHAASANPALTTTTTALKGGCRNLLWFFITHLLPAHVKRPGHGGGDDNGVVPVERSGSRHVTAATPKSNLAIIDSRS